MPILEFLILLLLSQTILKAKCLLKELRKLQVAFLIVKSNYALSQRKTSLNVAFETSMLIRPGARHNYFIYFTKVSGLDKNSSSASLTPTFFLI